MPSWKIRTALPTIAIVAPQNAHPGRSELISPARARNAGNHQHQACGVQRVRGQECAGIRHHGRELGGEEVVVLRPHQLTGQEQHRGQNERRRTEAWTWPTDERARHAHHEGGTAPAQQHCAGQQTQPQSTDGRAERFELGIPPAHLANPEPNEQTKSQHSAHDHRPEKHHDRSQVRTYRR